MWRQTNGWVTCAKPSRRNTEPRVSHTFSRRFLKQNYPKYVSDVLSKILEKKRTQLSDVLSEFVIFLKLGVLWWKLKIFIANFSHIAPKRFWRSFSMLLNSHPTIKWRWKNSVATTLMLNHNLTGLLGTLPKERLRINRWQQQKKAPKQRILCLIGHLFSR